MVMAGVLIGCAGFAMVVKEALRRLGRELRAEGRLK
jgi:hypothetical protein